MILMYAATSPFARKVRIAAIELGLEDRIELVAVEVRPGLPNRDFAERFNPLRKIPCMVTDAGQAIFDSHVICEYLDAESGGSRLVPTGGAARWATLTRHSLAQGMCDALISILRERTLRPEAVRWPTWIEDQRDRVINGLDWFATHLETESGSLPDLGQIMLGCVLGYLDFRFPEEEWRKGRPALRDWFAQIERRPSFVRTRP